MIRYFFPLSTVLSLALFGALTPPVIAQPFGSLSPTVLHDGRSNDWGDFDDDGQLDLILGTTVYRNQDGVFVDIKAGLEAIPAPSSDWGDYDNDGDLDLIVTGGNYLNDEFAAIVYRNDGGTFVDIAAGLAGVAGGSSDWGDYDGDGDLDLVLTGQISTFEQNVRIYRNDGNDTFTDIGAALGNAVQGSSKWGDYDGDGDLDLVITGSITATRIYRNDGGGTFVDIDADLEPVVFSSSDWGDYDADGDLDLVISGEADGGTTPVAIIYRNDGGGVFTDIGANLDAERITFSEWGDYDNDGDLDLVITADSKQSAIYRNDGSDSFTNIGADLIGTDGEGSWGDYDGDGDLDLIISGDITSLTTLYRNDGNDVFVNPNPIGLSGGSINWVDYDDDGDLDLFGTGNSAFATGQSVLYRNDGDGNLVDTEIQFVDVLGGSSDWGDYDGDGDVDLVVTGQAVAGNSVARIYRNDGNGTFTGIGAGLAGAVDASSKWGDYDNDGDLDLLISGVIYRNDGNDSFVDIGTGITIGGVGSRSDWGDYDGDGDLDFVLTGGQTTRVYRNDSGSFVDIGANLVGVNGGSSIWGDYDNDGDLDLAITGQDKDGTSRSTVYRNDNGSFVDIGANLVGVNGGSSIWGDYDRDGDLDLLLTGRTGSGDVATLYRNDGNDMFSDAEAGLIAVSLSSVDWGDYDGDGDLDLVVAGSISLIGPHTVVYENLRLGGSITSNEPDVTDLSKSFTLNQNFPNPFNPTTVISFNLPEATEVDLSVYNVVGQKVATLIDQPMTAGSHRVDFDASSLSSGVYLYKITAGNFVQTRKLTLIK